MEIIRDISSPYFIPGKVSRIKNIVLHSMDGFYKSTLNYFKKNDRGVSAHYCVSKEGEITQQVEDFNIAQHAGSYNTNSIGIELEDERKRAAWIYPEAEKRSIIELVLVLCAKYKIPLDKEHILLHKNLDPGRRSDPVGNFDLGWITGGIIEDEMATWLKTMFQEISIDLSKPEGEIRGKVQEVIDGFRKHGELEIKLQKLEKNYAGVAGQAAEFEERLIISERTIKRLNDDNADLKASVVSRDSDIHKLQTQVEVLTKQLDPNTTVVLTKEEYERLTAKKTLDKFKTTELIITVVKRLFTGFVKRKGGDSNG